MPLPFGTLLLLVCVQLAQGPEYRQPKPRAQARAQGSNMPCSVPETWDAFMCGTLTRV